MSGLFGSVTVKGNRLTDMVGQTSAVGRPIPFGYGYCKIDEPNVIWTAGIPKEHVKKKKQGKGGVKTEEYSYTLSYAIAFMAGPVYGFLTIIRGGKVVYTTDPNATVADKAFALKWRQKARFYYGTRTQMPDSTIESYVGAGKVSAFRDLCYIVVVDDDVTAEGGAVPQYEAVIIATPPDVYVTSKPYPVLSSDNVSVAVAPDDGVLRPLLHETTVVDSIDVTLTPFAAELRDRYLTASVLEKLAVLAEPTAASLRSAIKNADGGDDNLTTVVTPLGGVMRSALITLPAPSQDKLNITVTPLGGVLS